MKFITCEETFKKYNPESTHEDFLVLQKEIAEIQKIKMGYSKEEIEDFIILHGLEFNQASIDVFITFQKTKEEDIETI